MLEVTRAGPRRPQAERPVMARFWRMSEDRRKMTGRVVPLGSREAGAVPECGTADERVALVARLSELAWNLTARPRPVYTRATMPVRVRSLRELT